jgi:hypothetical protein
MRNNMLETMILYCIVLLILIGSYAFFRDSLVGLIENSFRALGLFI